MAFILCPSSSSFFSPLRSLETSVFACKLYDILLCTSITNSLLEAAHLMLFRFYELIPSLYPSTLCTMNCHTLIHLCESVERWGPLWCYSTFGFENLNGYIKRHCHGTRNVLPQLIHNVRTHQTLPFLSLVLQRILLPCIF